MAGELLAAVDIGGTKTTASLCGPEGILARVYQATRKRGDEGTIPRQVRYLVGEACRLAGVDLTRVTALGSGWRYIRPKCLLEIALQIGRAGSDIGRRGKPAAAAWAKPCMIEVLPLP